MFNFMRILYPYMLEIIYFIIYFQVRKSYKFKVFKIVWCIIPFLF